MLAGHLALALAAAFAGAAVYINSLSIPHGSNLMTKICSSSGNQVMRRATRCRHRWLSLPERLACLLGG